MTLKKTHFLIWRFLLLTFSCCLRSVIIDILKFNGLRHKHFRLELKLIRIQETKLELLTKLNLLLKIGSHHLLLLNDLACKLRRLMLRGDHIVVHVMILILPMQTITHDCLTPSDYLILRSRRNRRLHL
jgi:hypothetical protein